MGFSNTCVGARGAVLAAVVAVLLSSCAFTSGGEVVRVYSARHYDLEPAFRQFSEQTGIAVEFLDGGGAELRERIRAEGEDTLADVYMTVDAGNLHLAQQQGIFRSIDSPTLQDAVPESLRAPDGQWFGLSMRARTIVYNPDTVDPSELSTYEALADPKWKGRLCMRNSTNVYTQSLTASLIANHGRDRALEIIQGWVANDVNILNSDIRIIDNIDEGGCDVGIVNHYYLARLIADAREEDGEPPNVEVFWANQERSGVHVNISGAGVTTHADDPQLARRLLEWLATDGQRAFVEGNHEYPVNPEVSPEPLIAGFGEFDRDTLNASEFGSLNAEAVRLMDEAGYQ